MELFSSDSHIVMIATLAHPRDLCCIEASADVREKRHSSAKSAFHSRILKCRQLIFSNPQILVAPVLETESRMYIVMERKYYECGEIKKVLEKMKILGCNLISLSNNIFERCFLYTMKTKIAPLWNQVKGYLISGRSFLTCNEALSAVKLQICVNESKSFMIVWPLRVMLERTKLVDLGISQYVNQEFAVRSISTIFENEIESQWIHILPNFAKGQIKQITHHIPESCPYKTYKEMKQHWKNVYGYRLPEKEDDLIYYSVSDLNGTTIHVIPSPCVRSQDVILLDQTNTIPILELFHDVLMKKIPQICGHNIFTKTNLAYAFPKEEDSSLDMDFSISQLLSDEKYTDIIESDPLLLSSSPDSSTDIDNAEKRIIDDYDSSKGDKSSSTVSHSVDISGCDTYSAPELRKNEKSTDCLSLQKSIVSCDTTQPYSVHPRKPLQDIPQLLSLKNIEHWPSALEKSDVDAKSLHTSSKKSIYPENCHNDTRFIQTTLSRIALSAQKIEAVVSSSASQGVQNFYTFPSQNLLMEQTRVTSQTCLSFKDMLSSGNQQVNIISSNGQTCMPDKEMNLKRDASILGQNDILGLVKKKPRSRPQVQLDVDVELVARNNDLQRVNKITLVYWLRNKLVPCKVKDKKSDLVIKVMEYLNLPLEKVQ